MARFRQALYIAGVGPRAPVRGGNPMAGGTLDFLGDHGSFLFRMEEEPKPSSGLLPRPAQGRANNGKGAPTPWPVGQLEVVAQPDQVTIQVDEPQQEEEPMPISDSESLPDLNMPADKGKGVLTYQRRRSERIRKTQDGQRMGSVERAARRKASSEDASDASLGSDPTRRRKTQKLPDINAVAPLPSTTYPEVTSRQKLMDLASCCGLVDVDHLLNMQGKDALMNMDMMLKLKNKKKTLGEGSSHG